MAVAARRTALGLDGFLKAPARQQVPREDSWDFANSETRSEYSHDEDPMTLDESAQGEAYEVDDEDMDDNPARSITPAKYKEIINPLIVTADRFGREVEKFAEQLERLHPSKEKDPGTRYENALALADGYQDIAKATVERLRREHGPAHRSFLKEHWRARITGQAERAPGSLAIYDPEGSRGDPATVTTVADLTNWMQEQRTWVLFRQFIEFLCPRPGVNREQIQRDEPPAKDHIHQYSSEEKIWDRFLNEDELARERNIILTWLQQGGEESGDDLEIIGELLESGVDQGQGMWTQGWLHTKEAIKAQKRLRSWPQVLDPASPGLAASLLNGDKTESLVTQLDPDAVTRQRRVLDHQDQYSERSIWLACWHMLRRGKQWSEIREWCQDRAEGWRAVSLRGAIPAWDTAVDEHKSISDSTNGEGNSLEAGQETVAPRIEGNRSRALWRRVCFALARSGGLNEYERAVYGALSGDLETVEKVCLEWDDFLFAHYNSLVISQFDNYLQSRFPDRLPLALTRKFGLFDSVQYHGEPDTVGQRLVEQLKAHQVAGKEALTPMKIIQGSLIAKTFGELVYQHGITLAVLANRDNRSKLLPLLQEAGEGPQDPSRLRGDDFDVLRVLCHMVLICQELGLDMGYGDRRATVENVIVAYIDFLRLAGKISMVPLYASRLPVERQIPTLAIVLRDVTSPARRRELVRLMEGYGIDVCKVIKKQIGSFLKESGMKLNEIKDESITVQILEDTPPGQLRLPPIKDDFIGTELDAVDEGLISSFEWYLYVDGHWKETFVAGASLFKRFFHGKKLAAARRLAERMSSSHISQAKTPAILGEAVDITWDWEDEIQSQLAQTGLDDEDDGGRRRRSSSIDRQRMTRQILAAQAKLYTEFEKLAWALTELEGWSKVMHAKSYDFGRSNKSWKSQVQNAFDKVQRTVEPLLHGWLVDYPPKHQKGIQAIRNAYLPEVILAYHNVLYDAGHHLRREILPQCMTLSTIIAAPTSDLLPCFQHAQRLPQLVTALALSSKAILRLEETKSKNPTGGKSRKRGVGETMTLWHVKP